MTDPNQPSWREPDRPQPTGSAPEPQAGYGYPQPQPYPPIAPGGAYGQPYGYLPEHPQGTVILVLGIVGFFATICAPIAWYLGSKAQKEIAASGQHYSNEQNINIGKVMGMVLSILALAGIALTIIVMIVMAVGYGAFGLANR